MKNLLFLVTIVLIAAPVAAQAQNVKVAYDPSVDFTKFKTYSWIKGEPASNPQIHKFIVDGIDRQLQSRGLKKVEAGADLNVTYYASLDENINTSAVEYMKSADWKKWGDHDPVYGPKMVAMRMPGWCLTSLRLQPTGWSGKDAPETLIPPITREVKSA